MITTTRIGGTSIVREAPEGFKQMADKFEPQHAEFAKNS